MTQQEILEFINKNKTCTLATCEGNKPHVRGMFIYRADDKGIIFHTGDFKDVFKHLQNNPNVELCFINDNIQIRINGTAVLENDLNLKEEIVANRPFLKNVIDKYGFESIHVFRVQKMAATVWSMATNLAPKEYIELNGRG